MPFAKRMRYVRQLEYDVVGLAGFERHRLFKTPAEFSSKWLAANELLIAAHWDQGSRGRRTCRRRSRRRSRSVVVWIIAGINIDHLDNKVGIGAAGRDFQ